jgi:hypothetical protein
MNILHIIIEVVFAAIGIACFWSIQRDLREAFRIISRGR